MSLALEVALRFDDLEKAIGAETANVSREGLFITMDRPKPLGTPVKVRLQNARTATAFTLEGVVVRCLPDLEDPRPLEPGQTRGIAVFLTRTTEEWARFCDALAERRADELNAGPTVPERPKFAVD